MQVGCALVLRLLALNLKRKPGIKAHLPEFLFSQVLAYSLQMGRDGRLTGTGGMYLVGLGGELPELSVLRLSV